MDYELTWEPEARRNLEKETIYLRERLRRRGRKFSSGPDNFTRNSAHPPNGGAVFLDGRSAMAARGFDTGWDRLRRPVWLYDPQTGQKPYANPAALALWGADSLEALAARDFSARSPAM